MNKIRLVGIAALMGILFALPVHAALPVVDIDANGLDGPVAITTAQPAQITVSLDDGDYAGHPMEWWVAALTSYGNFFLDSTLNWIGAVVPIPVGNFGLVDVAPVSILNANLPVGDYYFYFVLDNTINGIPDDFTLVDTVRVTVTSGAGVPATIDLSSNPSQILADGRTTSLITALVKDAAGDPVADGTVVTFTTGAGTLSGSQATTVSGYARVTLTSSTSPVTATIQGQTAAISNTTTVQFVRTVADISVGADPTSIPSDGSTYSLITATLTDGFGNPAPKGTQVTFTTTLGVFSNGQKSHTVILPDTTGIMTNLLTGTTGGTASITVSAAGVTSDPVTVVIGSGGPSSIDLRANPAETPADGVSPSTLTATVKCVNGDDAPDGTVVNFSITSGTGVLSAPSASTSAGKASVTLTSGVIGSVSVKAEVASIPTLYKTVSVSFVSIVPGSISLQADPLLVPADGARASTLTATVLTTEGDPVPDGTSVNFSITSGSGALSSASATTSVGIASVTVTSTVVGSVTVKAEVAADPTLNRSVSVSFASTAPASISLEANPTQVAADGTSAITLTATVKSASGYTVPDGRLVGFVITSGTGTLSAASATTVDGDASVTVTSTVIGAVTVQAEVISQPGLNDATTVNFIGIPPAEIDLTATPDELPADGTTQSILEATVKNASGGMVPDGTVINFTITSGIGILSAGSATTTGGIATVSLVSGNAGQVTVKASATQGGASDTVTVSFTQSPASLSLTASQTTVKSDNSDFALITATVLDVNYVPYEGATVMFSVNGGQLSASSALSDTSGKAQVQFSSGTISQANRIITVTASVTGLGTKEIPIQVTGTTVSLSSNRTNLEIDPFDPDKARANLMVLVRDAGDKPIYDAEVTLSVSAASTGDATITPSSGTTDVLGTLTVVVEGTSAGQVIVEADALGATATQTYTVGATGEVLSIIFPDENPYRMHTLSRAISGPSDEISFEAATRRISRSDGGSFIADGFLDGDQIEVKGSDSNDGVYTVTTVAATTLTLDPGDTLTDEVAGAEVTITEIRIDETAETGPSTQISFGAFPDVIVRGDGGSFLNDGFLGSEKVRVRGSAANDGIYTIATVEAGRITLLGDGQLTQEGVGANVTLTQIEILPGVRAVAITGPTAQVSFTDASPPTIDRWDGGDFVADGFLAGDAISVGGSDANDGAYTVAAVSANTLTLAASDTLIDEPVGATVTITNGLLIKVWAPHQDTITFATTFGTWDGGIYMTARKNVANYQAMAVLSSALAGIATVEVYDPDDPDLRDSLTVAISAPSSEASQISLQASTAVVAPSVGGVSNTVELIAKVRNIADQVVGGAPVSFSIVNPTGGGESVSPVITFTDDYGIARSTFTSGSLSSGTEGVTVEAIVVGMPAVTPAEVAIVIGGTAGSVVIGHASTVTSINNDTGYKLPMSVLVVDSNGNAVSGATVSLSVWPANYAQGYWFYDPTTDLCYPSREGTYQNEDINQNLILDNYVSDLCGTPYNGEDVNGDCKLTPSNSAGGSVPNTVTTDANGVAEFDLIYLKSSSAWIHTEIRASTLVLGTETQSASTFWLPYVPTEGCILPDSPYNDERPVAHVSLTASPSVLTPDGESESTIRASVTDENGRPVADGERIEFGITGGTSGGGLPYSSTASATTVSGVATVTYRASETAGTVEITGSASNGVSDTVELTLDEGDVSVTAAPDELLADGTSRSTITALVTDGLGNPVPDNTRVDFVISQGGGGLPYYTHDWSYTISGLASATYEAGDTPGTVRINVTAQTGASGSVEITLTAMNISLSASPAELLADGTSRSTVTAVVTDHNGDPVPDNERVDFRVTQGTGGLPYSSSTWDLTVGGVASATYEAGETPGVVEITANAPTGASKTVNITLIQTVSGISLSVTPNELLADGKSESSLVATVTDGNGDPAPDGQRIDFTISAGSGGLPYAATTWDYTSGGLATATYRAGTAAGTVTVKASSSSGASDTADITLIGGGLGSVTVTSGSPSIVADGSAQTLISATVKDTNGNNVPDGTTVDFSTTAGTLSAASATTNYGVATVLLTSSTKVGTAKVTASTGGVSGDVSVDFVPGPVNALSLTATPSNLTADGDSTSTIRVMVRDAGGNAIDDETISFTVTTGTGTLSAPTATTSGGVATVTYTASTTAGVETITAESTNGTSDTVNVTLVAATVGTVTVTSGSSNVVADGTASTLISATVKDTNGNNVADGTTVNFSTTAGTLSAASATTTNGVATVTLTSATILGSATVTATSGGVSDTTIVNFVAGAVNTVTVLATPDNLSADGTSTSTITATVLDANSNPVSGETISFTAVSGTLSAANATTSASGVATVTYTAPATVPGGGTDTVTGTSTNGKTGNDTITLVAATVGTVTVTAGSSTVVADGVSATLIAVTVKDINGNNVADGTTVNFSTTAGTLSAASATTTNGVTTVTLTSATNVGTATVTATCGGVSGTKTVDFIADEVDDVSLSATPNNLSADGVSTSTIRAVVTDAQGNAIDGETISFSVTVGTGTLSAPTATTTGGVATVTYTASTTAGAETITAESTNGTSDTVNVTLVAATVGTVEATAGTSSIVADGASSTLITARVKDTNGNNVADGTTVNFTTTAGGLSAASATTTNGVATVTLTSTTTVGTTTVTATSGGISDTTTVNFVAGPVSGIAMTATPSNVSADGVSTSTIRAVVTDAQGNAIDGETISFSVTVGTGTLSAPTAVTTGGVATVTYTASTTAGVETVRAESANGTSDTVNVILVAATVGTVTVNAGSSSIVADGSSSTLITAVVEDINGYDVADGTTVNFSTTSGTLSAASATTTNGLATVTLTSAMNVGAATVTATCGGVSGNATVNFVADEVDDVSLAAQPNTLSADGVSTSTIRAVVTDAQGNAIDGETISFSVTVGTGTLSAPTAITTGGVATVTYIASTTAGVETVRAESTNGTSDTVNVTLVTATVGTVTVTAGSSSIVADGTSSTLITATVTDINGNKVADGTTVNFSTTAGTLSAASATTTNGVATVTLTSATILGSATVTATSGSVSDTTTVNFVSGAVNTVTVLATPDNLSADGTSTSTITATVLDADSNPVSGETISFTAVSGTLSAASANTNVSGVATVTYTAPATVPGGGTDTVTGTSTNGKTGNDTINLVAATVGSVTVTAGSTSIVADGSSSTVITATVKDPSGNTIEDGTTVNFTTTAGTLSAASATTTNGVATVTLTSSTHLGTATVRATCGGVSNTVSVAFVSDVPNQVTVSATPSNLTADGTSTSTIRVVVLDANDNPVADGTQLTFSVDYGTLSNLSATTTDGVATITYTAPSAVPAGDRATVTATTVNGVSGNAAITLIGAQIATISLTASPTSLPADGASTATISATLTVVGGGSPPDGTTVNFSITRGGGAITASATTADGVASATLTAGNVAETATIQAGSGGRTAQIDVEYTPGSVTLTIIPNALLGTGEETASVTALLKAADGSPAPDGETVNFTLSSEDLGDIPASAVTVGGEGEAEVTFTAAAKGGTVTVTGTWNTGGVDVTGTGDITIYPPPAFIQVADGYPDPASINIKGTGGQPNSQIVFDVKDSSGELVVDGYRIDFTILSGPNGGEEISPLLTTTSGGQAGTILTSGYKSGPVSVKAKYFHDTSVTTTTGDIAIVSGPPVGEALGVFAHYVNISGLWKMNLRDTITVNAGDIYGNAVPNGTAISFKTYNTGGLFDPGTAATSGGLASSELVSVPDPDPMQGFVSVTGEAVNGGRTTHVTTLFIDPASTNVVYAGTDGGGVYKSIDFGVTWRNVSSSSTVPGQNWIDPYVNDIAVDPENNNTIYAATGYLGNGRVYRSLDGAANWNSNNAEEYYGVLSSDSAVLTVLCDDSGDYVWVGTQANGVYYTTDGTATPNITWAQAATLADGTTVSDIVKAPGTHGAGAVLYAATATGIFRSADGGATWADMSSFTGDSIQTLALHPSSTGGGTDVIYAGTTDAGVWVSANSGGTWTQYVTGMGRGLSASTPVADPENTGTGVMSRVTVGDDAESEYWTVACKTAAAGGGTFSVTGTVSGVQADYDITTGGYTIAGVMAFTITAGATDFAVDDEFTFRTTRDPGWGIMDLLVDAGNNYLYAVTYFWGPLEPHAVGNMYRTQIDAVTHLPTGVWDVATDGLPQYDPPDDTTLLAQHVMGSDIAPYVSAAPSALYIGGEGISLYQAETDLPGGDPQWQQSDSGLTNRIMARMPILFSGVCTMSITETPPVLPSTDYTYTIYIEDINGNPPVSGSTFTVTLYDADGAFISTVLDVTYPDTYTYTGTYRDPSDATTDNPYTVAIDYSGAVSEAKFSFTPTCEDTVPGCSGSNQTESYFN